MARTYYLVTMEKKEGSTEIVYPQGYIGGIDALVKDHLYYDDPDFRLIIALENVNPATITRKGIVQITKEEAIAISRRVEQPEIIVTSQSTVSYIENKLRLLALKAAVGTLTSKETQGLTEEEQKAIDPDQPTLGYGRKKTFADRILELDKK